MEETQQWFVMRDLCRGLANQYTYEKLASQGFETFAPTVARRKTVRGKIVIVKCPYIRDLFFIHSTFSELQSVMTPGCRFQFRYRFGVRPPARKPE